ncbi:MAG: CpaF/VirB11 family protein [Oscillospiraceae bacterium]
MEDNVADSEELLASYVRKFLEENSLTVGSLTQEQLLTKLLDEMLRYSFLTKYLVCDDVEEVNINSWEDVKITYTSGEVLPATEHFRTPGHAVDVVRRMLRESNMIWDNAQCIQVGHLAGNIRITATGFDMVDKEKALSVSIRKVNPKQLQKADFLKMGTATEEMLDFLQQVYTHDVSLCLTGATGSGKTTLLAWVLSHVPYQKRLITLEQGTREFDCTVRDAAGKILNSVVHFSTRYSDDAKQNISQIKLLETIMTMNPDYIAVGESKGEEAMQTVSAANTGHSVITTTHANSAEATYFRFVSLCKLQYPSMDEKLLTTLAVQAFPIVVFVKKLNDNTRRILQINEAEMGDDGEIVYRPLYRYVIVRNTVKNGQPFVDGYFEKVNAPSARLKERLIANGLQDKWVNKFWREEAKQ